MDPAAKTTDLPYRFGLVVMGLAQLVANQFSKDPTREPFLARIYFSLRRRLRRFEQVFGRAQAELHAATGDTEPSRGDASTSASPQRPGAEPAGKGTAGAERTADRKPYARLPRKRGWMLDMMPGQAALFWFRLDMLLRDPEMVAFLATSRKARRLLRPLWYGLCIDPLPACLREPPVEAALARGCAASGDAAAPAGVRGLAHLVAPADPEPADRDRMAPSPASSPLRS